MNRFVALAVAALVSLPAPAWASKEAPGVLSLRSLVGVNTTTPTAEIQLGVRLPIGDGRFEPFLAHAPWGTLSPDTSFSLTHAGLRTYLGSPPQPLYALVSAGVFDHSKNGRGPAVLLGLGADWMPWSWIGVSGSVVIFNLVVVRPMIGLRLTL